MNYPVSPRILREDSKNSTYTETKPSNLFKNIVSCFWCLSAKTQLDKSFELENLSIFLAERKLKMLKNIKKNIINLN